MLWLIYCKGLSALELFPPLLWYQHGFTCGYNCRSSCWTRQGHFYCHVAQSACAAMCAESSAWVCVLQPFLRNGFSMHNNSQHIKIISIKWFGDIGKTDFKACYYATVMGFKKETFFLACYKYLIMPLWSQARKPSRLCMRKATLQ